MKFLKMLAWLALAGMLLLPACSSSTPASPTQPVATAPASTATSRSTATRTATPVQETSEGSAYPAPGGAASVGPSPESAYPAPAGNTTDSSFSFETPPPAAYPPPGSEQPAASAGDPSFQSNTPYPAPGDPQSGPPPVPTNAAPAVTGTPVSTGSPGGLLTPSPTLSGQNPAATGTSSSEGNSPYPGPAQTTQPAPAVQSTPGRTAAAPNTPRATPTAPATGVPTGTPSGYEPGATGTALPTTPPPVRVALQATDPSTVQLDAGQLQLVEFFAYWSPMCKSMAPVVHRLEDTYSGRILFTYLNVDDRLNDRFKQSLGYQFVPHFFLIDGQGEILKEWKGYVRAEDLVAEFNAQGIAP